MLPCLRIPPPSSTGLDFRARTGLVAALPLLCQPRKGSLRCRPAGRDRLPRFKLLHSADRLTDTDASRRCSGRIVHRPGAGNGTVEVAQHGPAWPKLPCGRFHRANCRDDDGARGATAECQQLFSSRVTRVAAWQPASWRGQSL